MRCGLKLFTGNHVISVLRTCQAGQKEAQLACCPAWAWQSCMGVATQMSRPCPMCPTPSGQEEYHTKNTQNTSKSILESNRMKNQMSVTDLPAASRPLVGPTGPDVPVTTVISQTIGPLK